jgi:hypothetical protein
MGSETADQPEVDDRGLIAAGYLTAFLAPIVGILVAGYLFLRKQRRHATICLAISIIVPLGAYLLLFVSDDVPDEPRSENSSALQRYQSCLGDHMAAECRHVFPEELKGGG